MGWKAIVIGTGSGLRLRQSLHPRASKDSLLSNGAPSMRRTGIAIGRWDEVIATLSARRCQNSAGTAPVFCHFSAFVPRWRAARGKI
jgi:hypothetical protein